MTSNSTFQIVICSDMAWIVGVCEGKVYVDLVFVHVYICMCMWFVFMYMYLVYVSVCIWGIFIFMWPPCM